MDKPRPAALAQLIQVAHEAAERHENPLVHLSTALTTAATSSADPYLVIDNLLRAVPQIIAARVPLDRQAQIGTEVEARFSELLAAWQLK